MKYIRGFLIVVIGLFLKGSRKSWDSSPKEEFKARDDIDSPADLPKSRWKAALKRTKQALKDKELGMAAAGLAYYTTLTFFPAALGLATLYTSIAGGQALLDLLSDLEIVVPPVIQDLLQTQLGPLAQAESTTLGVAFLVSLLAVLWTTSGGIQNLVKALNLTYDVKETRNFIKLRLLSVGLSGVFILFTAVILVLLVLQGDALHALGVPSSMANLFPLLRWPILIIVLSLALAVIYRYAPNRDDPKWSWVSWGATAATIIWIIGTVLFFFYAQNFGNFNKSYGTFASIIILMVWFNLSSLIVLVGAQVNKKLEDETDSVTMKD